MPICQEELFRLADLLTKKIERDGAPSHWIILFIRILTGLCLIWWNRCPVCAWPLRIAAVRPLLAFFLCAIPPSAMTTRCIFNAEVWNICLSHDRLIIRVYSFDTKHNIFSFCMLSYKYVLYQRLSVTCNYLFMAERQSLLRWTAV